MACEVWVKENGGDDALLSVLKENGFASKLSLKHLDLDSEEAISFRSSLNYGQICLLKGLIRLVTPPGINESYGACSSKAISVGNKINAVKPTLREKLGKLFHHSSASSSASSSPSSSGFVPKASPSLGTKKAPKRKGSGSLAKCVKKKIKQVKLKVIALPHLMKNTPTGEVRESLTYFVWLNCDASEDDVKDIIAAEVGFTKESITFLYAQGKNLRLASLADVANADCWDVETVRALMGAGSLYITGKPYADEDIEIETSIFDEDCAYSDDISIMEDRNHSVIETVVDEEHTYSDNISIMEDRKHSDDSSGLSSCPPLPPSLPGLILANDTSFTCTTTLLISHSSTVLDESSEYNISIDRSSDELFWAGLVAFYKGAISNPEKLQKKLVVTFVGTGEIGSDCGSLRKEFFEAGLSLANKKLFEGESLKRVPKKDLSLEMLFEVTGLLIAHSIVQDGPGFPYLSQYVFDFLSHQDITQCYPTIDDLPLNASTSDVLNLIKELDKVSDIKEIYSLFDDKCNLALMNNSRWSVTEPITMKNRHAFQQELILEEAVSRREANLRAFSRGVGVRTLGILRLLQEYPHLMKALFMHVPGSSSVTAGLLMSLFESTPNTSSEILSYEMFLRFVIHIEENDLGTSISPSALLRFITGLSCIPPKSTLISIRIKFHSGSSSSNPLPRVVACTNTVYLPVIHKSDDDFFKHFITALNFGMAYGSV